MPKNAEEYWEALVASGWLASVPRKKHASYRSQIDWHFKHDPRGVFQVLATVISGYVREPGDYVRALMEYSEATHEVFRPTQARDSLDPEAETATISFRFRGRRFERTIPYPGDGVHEEFVAFLHDVLDQFKIRQRFIDLHPQDETCGFIVFVDPELYDRAVELGLIPEFWDWPEYDWFLSPPRRRRRTAKKRKKGKKGTRR